MNHHDMLSDARACAELWLKRLNIDKETKHLK